MSQEITNADIFLWALGELGGASAFVDVEDVYAFAFDAAPVRLSWRTRPDLPDLKKCSKALRDAEAREPTLLAKSSDRYKRQLTMEGHAWVEANADRIRAALGSGSASLQSTGRQKTSDDRRFEREALRLMSTVAFQKLNVGEANSITSQEAEAFFRLNDYITGANRNAKIQRVLHMFQDDARLSGAIREIAERVPKAR